MPKPAARRANTARCGKPGLTRRNGSSTPSLRALCASNPEFPVRTVRQFSSLRRYSKAQCRTLLEIVLYNTVLTILDNTIICAARIAHLVRRTIFTKGEPEIWSNRAGTGNMSIGIKTYGAFVPQLRMAKAAIADAHAWALPNLKALARGERALCSWDEDAITMAVQASRQCIAAAPSARVTGLKLASTTAPFADLQNATIVSAALRLPAEVPCQDVSGSTRAGLSALGQTLRCADRED